MKELINKILSAAIITTNLSVSIILLFIILLEVIVNSPWYLCVLPLWLVINYWLVLDIHKKIKKGD
jgi:type IV secretory pathway VirB3-like protein